ncbi:MAG: hypothetical protein ACXU8U_09605 [Asticcacaulis sp.]
MFVPYVPLTNRTVSPRTRALQGIMTALFMGSFMLALILADPHHRYAITLLDAAANWLHAAVLQLIK